MKLNAYYINGNKYILDAYYIHGNKYILYT